MIKLRPMRCKQKFCVTSMRVPYKGTGKHHFGPSAFSLCWPATHMWWLEFWKPFWTMRCRLWCNGRRGSWSIREDLFINQKKEALRPQNTLGWLANKIWKWIESTEEFLSLLFLGRTLSLSQRATMRAFDRSCDSPEKLEHKIKQWFTGFVWRL